MKRSGFTIIEVVVIVAVVSILLMIAMPNFTSIALRVKRDVCITNLRRINLAKEQWALENNVEESDNVTPTALQLDEYIKDETSSLICPLDPNKTFATSYTINVFGTEPTCNISPADHKL